MIKGAVKEETAIHVCGDDDDDGEQLSVIKAITSVACVNLQNLQGNKRISEEGSTYPVIVPMISN